MEYLLAIAIDESLPAPAPGDPGFDEGMAAWGEYTRSLMAGGHWISGASLAPSSTATTVRRRPGAADELVDGPFAETKEVFGGFYVVEAADLDEALRLAAAIPIFAGSVEVRPLAAKPDANGDPRPVAP